MTHLHTGKWLRGAVFGLALTLQAVPLAVHAQTVRQQDISVQLQTSLEQAAPTVVYFGFDQDSLTAESRAVLDQQASWLMSNSSAKVDLAGHTDAVGTNTYNDDLAMRRARAVENYLFQRGVSPAQMRSVVSRGENDLAVPTERKERLNRRVSTRVTGLVEIVEAAPPAPPPAAPRPPTREYAEGPGGFCTNGTTETATLVAMGKSDLQFALSTRLDNAADLYNSDAAARDTGGLFHRAAFVKMQCGIAIGYVKKGIRDQRSIGNCTCLDNNG